MKVSSKHPRVESSTGDASRPPPSGDPTAEEYVDPIAVVDPPPSNIKRLFLACLVGYCYDRSSGAWTASVGSAQ